MKYIYIDIGINDHGRFSTPKDFIDGANTVYQRLQDYGFDIVLHEDNKKGYFMASRLFEDWELKVLLDAAIEAYFFTAADSRKFTEKIAALGSRDCRRMLRQVTPIETDLHKGLPMTKNYIDTVLDPIYC